MSDHLASSDALVITKGDTSALCGLYLKSSPNSATGFLFEVRNIRWSGVKACYNVLIIARSYKQGTLLGSYEQENGFYAASTEAVSSFFSG